MKLKVEKLAYVPLSRKIAVPILAVVIALLIMGMFLWINLKSFSDVLTAYKEMFTWPFSPQMGFFDTLAKMVPLLLIALGLSVVFRMRVWNIGAEGQLYLGAMLTTWGALYWLNDSVNPWLAVPVLLIIGSAGGALWAIIPALLKAYLNLNEIVATLMLNYVAYHWVNYLIYGPWRDPKGYNFPVTSLFPRTTWLPKIGDLDIHYGLVIALVITVAIYLLCYRTRWGFRVKIIGDNPIAAEYAGIDIRASIVAAFAISGALSGLAGSVQMLGIQHRLLHGFSPGYGYTAIIVAWLARLNPWAVVLVSFLFGGLLVGGEQLQIVLRLPVSMIYILQGIVLFTLLAFETVARYRIQFAKD